MENSTYFGLNSFPILKTERLILRELSMEDGPDIFEMQSNPIMCEHNDTLPETQLEGSLKYIEKMVSGFRDEKWISWGIELASTGKVIGTICIWNFSEDKGEAELGYGLTPDYHGKGFMGDALNAVANFCFHALEMRMLDAYTEENNAPSIALLKRAGFEHVGMVTDQGFFTDRNYNMKIFRLFRDHMLNSTVE